MDNFEKIIEITKTKGHECQHNKFKLNPQNGYVECAICGEHLNPVWVIEQYANAEHRLFQKLERLQRLAKEIENKTKCKCEHCGKMTRIASSRQINKTYY